MPQRPSLARRRDPVVTWSGSSCHSWAISHTLVPPPLLHQRPMQAPSGPPPHPSPPLRLLPLVQRCDCRLSVALTTTHSRRPSLQALLHRQLLLRLVLALLLLLPPPHLRACAHTPLATATGMGMGTLQHTASLTGTGMGTDRATGTPTRALYRRCPTATVTASRGGYRQRRRTGHTRTWVDMRTHRCVWTVSWGTAGPRWRPSPSCPRRTRGHPRQVPLHHRTVCPLSSCSV